MIDLDRINIESTNWAAAQIQERYPIAYVGGMKPAEADAWLTTYHEHQDAYLGIIGALRRPGRAWVDVQLVSGRWVGQWVEDCPSLAALSCAYWWKEPVIAAGVGARDVAKLAERVDAGDLLALLGDSW